MGLTSLQVCMDSSDWLQGMVHDDDGGIDSSPSSGADIITCSRPLLERRLRPQHDQALKCPRCDSTHTKFCYYNNYSLTQPRYFCKTCRRYWTKGGSLRNIPVGGGCRKNKRVSVKKSSSNDHHPTLNNHHQHSANNSSSNDTTTTDLHLSFPHDHQLQLPNFTTLFSNSSSGHDLGNLSSLMESKYNAILDQTNTNPRQVDFLECTKYDNIIGNPTSHDFMGNNDHLGLVGDLGNHGFTPSNFHGLCSNPFGIPLNGSNNESLMMNNCQRMMLPFEGSDDQDANAFEMKPTKQLLSIEWQDNNQGCSEVGKDSFGYFNSLGSWTGAMMNGYGSSQTNPLV